jgi:hypothetical protein
MFSLPSGFLASVSSFASTSGVSRYGGDGYKTEKFNKNY